MMARILTSLLAVVAVSWAVPPHAEDVRQDPVVVAQAWARATAGLANTTAVYFTVRADPGRGDRLLAASSPLAETAVLHSRDMRDGTTSMRAVASIDVPAGRDVTLRPGGTHIMLTGLSVTLRPGDRLPLTLLFADAGQVTISVPVLPLSALGPETGP